MFVHETSHVTDTVGNSGAKIYQNCVVKNSLLGANATVGDFSRLFDCDLRDNVAIQRNAMMYSTRVGRYSYTGQRFTSWHCSIGAFCSISWNVSVGGDDHDVKRTTTHSFLYQRELGLMPVDTEPEYARFKEKCEVGNDVWLAAGACICRGVTVGTGAAVAAGAVVIRDVEPYTVVAGVPARPIKKRFSDDIIERLLESRWWEFPPEVIRDNFNLFQSYTDRNTADRLLEIRRKLDADQR